MRVSQPHYSILFSTGLLNILLGATKFLLVSYPDFVLFPYHAYNSQSGNQLLDSFSISLTKEIVELATPRRLVAYADLFALFQDFVSRPLHYGFDPNVLGDSCLTGAYFEAPRTLCDDPDKYVFWDEFHVKIHFPPTSSYEY